MVGCHLDRNTNANAVTGGVVREKKGCFGRFARRDNGQATGDSYPGALSRFRWSWRSHALTLFGLSC
jgi:hypothetical protein